MVEEKGNDLGGWKGFLKDLVKQDPNNRGWYEKMIESGASPEKLLNEVQK